LESKVTPWECPISPDLNHGATLAGVRARPQRILIERGGGPGGGTLRAEIDPANVPAEVQGALSRLLDEAKAPAPDAPPEDAATYDVVLDYGDRTERLRYDEAELADDVRSALDSRLAAGR
jgi:hypothetical protein